MASFFKKKHQKQSSKSQASPTHSISMEHSQAEGTTTTTRPITGVDNSIESPSKQNTAIGFFKSSRHNKHHEQSNQSTTHPITPPRPASGSDRVANNFSRQNSGHGLVVQTPPQSEPQGHHKNGNGNGNDNGNGNAIGNSPSLSRNVPLNTPSQLNNKNNDILQQKKYQGLQHHTPWKKKKLFNSPFPRFSHAASALTSDTGAIYLMGGLCGANVFGDMWVIEPVKQNNNEKIYPYIASPIENFERIPAPRIGHASVLIGNAFIVFAGDTVTTSTQVLDNKLYFFNISSLKWTITSPEGQRPEGRYGHQISVLNFEMKDKPGTWLSYLYVFGGQLEHEYFNDIWKFDLSNFRNPKTRWQKIASKGDDIPPPLANHSMTAFGNKLYIYGGSNNSVVSKDLYCFDPVTESWSKCELHGKFKPPALTDHSAALFQNLLFIFGGKLANDKMSGDLYVIDLNNMNSFKVLSNLPFSPGPRCGHSITVDPNSEKLIIMGGDPIDTDFTGVVDEMNEAIDESRFTRGSSVIFEFDINQLTQYMEKASTPLAPISRDLHSAQSSQSNVNLSDDVKDSNNIVQKQAHRLSQYDAVNNENNAIKLISSAPILNNDDTVDKDELSNISLTDNDETDLHANELATEVQNHEKSLDNNSENTPSPETIKSDIKRINNFPESVSDSSINNFYVDAEPVLQSPTTISTDLSGKLKEHEVQIEHENEIEDQEKEEGHSDHSYPTMSAMNTPSLQQTPVMPCNKVNDFPFSPAVSAKDNVKLHNLLSMITNLKEEMTVKVEEANNKIVQLETEKNKALDDLSSLQKNQSINIQQIPVNDRSFISNQMNDLLDLNELVKSQQNIILHLKDKLETEEVLKKRIFDLESHCNTISFEYNNLKLLSGVNDRNSKDNNPKTLPVFDQVNQLTTKMDSVLALWSKQLTMPHSKNFEALEREIEHLSNREKELSKESEIKEIKLKNLESSYKESITSLNSTHKALLLSGNELTKFRERNKLLSNELDDLKLKKRVFSNSSSRIISINKQITSDNLNTNNGLVNESQESSGSELYEEDEEADDIDQRYAVKITNLEADLFIVGQERDQLKDELVKVKKQLFAATTSSPII